MRAASNVVPPLRERIREWGIQKFGSEDYRNAGPMRPTMARVLSSAIEGVIHNAARRNMLDAPELQKQLIELISAYLSGSKAAA